MPEVRFMEQSYQILGWYGQYPHGQEEEPYGFIADVARTCYDSMGTGEESDRRLVRSLIKNDHGAMLEHSFLSVRFHTDRAIANELVRHRHFSFAQMSTRYVNSSKQGFEFILPKMAGGGLMDGHRLDCIKRTCQFAAEQYEELVSCGTRPEIARAVLPLCTKTTIVCSGNFRSWREMFKLRVDRHAHPQMRELMTELLEDLKHHYIPVIFDDIEAS